MNRNNIAYESLIKKSVHEIVEVMRKNYEPWYEEASINDICHYELHVICSFITRWLLQMTEVSTTPDGKDITLQMAFDEFIHIMQSCVDEMGDKKKPKKKKVPH